MRPLAVCVALSLTVPAIGQKSEVVGDVRIQLLNYGLVRLEQRGPKGFEDRKTFHVVGREPWPDVDYNRRDLDDRVEIETSSWRVVVPRPTTGLRGVKILGRQNEVLYAFDGKLTNSAWLPSPGAGFKAWAIADTPRLVPSRYGLTPDPLGGETSGWDLSNDAADVYVFLAMRHPAFDLMGLDKTIYLRSDFLKLTGPIEMPPLYALGFVDSKYYAYQQDEALARIDEYRRRGIPLDTFVVDTDWRLGGSHGYSVDPKYFPDMPAFLRKAHEKHVRIMFNDHPEPQGKTAFDPVELKYRFNGLSDLLKQGVDIWWYDRNWHVGIPQPAPNLARETWGMALYHDITLRTKPNQRPLIMANVDGIDNGYRNRPPNIAAHRYPVQWTGDTRAEWIFLRKGVENAVHQGVQALNPWVNEDLGGHAGKPDPKLYIRFLQFGSVSPFMRVHCTKGDTREPWAFGPDAERIVPEYIKMRYRLMPYLYSLARTAYDTGEPLLRRLDLEFPQYKEALAEDQFLLGESILVAPIVGGHETSVVPARAFEQPIYAEYFANKDLSGVAPIHGPANAIDFDWRTGAPDPHLPSDNFSARWTGKIMVPRDHPYRLSVTADDGVRLWVDGKLVVDKWAPQDSVTTEAPVNLQPGSTHSFKIEYMELTYNAVCKLRWRPVTGSNDLSERSCWIPPGTWTDVWTGKRIIGPKTVAVKAPLEQMPMFVRSGGIIPLGPDVQWTGQKDWSSLALNVYPGQGYSSVYEDDGESLGYQRKQFRWTPIRMIQHGDASRLSIGPSIGAYPRAAPQRSWVVRIVSPTLKSVTVDGKPYRARRIVAARAQPFRNAGGEPTGPVFEVRLPAAVTTKRHVVVIRR